MEKQRFRRGDVLVASGKELILKFTPCAVLPGNFHNFFSNLTV